MKLAFKILLILLIVGGIAFVVVKSFGGVSDAKVEEVKVTEFERHIDARVTEEIAGKSYEEALDAFEDIGAEILTESKVTTSDGMPSITEDEKERTLKRAFYEFHPIFLNHTKAYFRRSSWNTSDMEDFQDVSESLIEMEIAERNTMAYTDLQNIIQIVKDYNTARRLVGNYSVSTLSALESYISQVRTYRQKDPLKNNTSLVSDLTQAETNAKRHYADKLIAVCNNIAANYRNYGSYENFYDAYNSVSSSISSYVNKYGNDGRFSTARSNLNAADQYAMSYYSN